MRIDEKSPETKVVGWIKSHKVAASCIAGAVTLAIVGGIVATVVVSNPDSPKPTVSATPTVKPTTAADWDATKAAFAESAEASAAAAASLAQAQTVFDAAAAAKVDVEALRASTEKLDDALTQEDYGITEGENAYVVKTPEVTVVKPKPVLDSATTSEKAVFDKKLAADVETFAKATKRVDEQTKSIEQFIEVVTGDAIAKSYLTVAPAVVKYAAGAGAALQAAIDAKVVSAQNLVDAFNAVLVIQGQAPVVVPAQPGSPSRPSSPGNPNPPVSPAQPAPVAPAQPAPAQPAQPAPVTPAQPAPPAPVVPPTPVVPHTPVAPPAPREMSTDAVEGGIHGKCIQVGTASATGGHVWTPPGVTNFTKSWDGSRWQIVWYACM